MNLNSIRKSEAIKNFSINSITYPHYTPYWYAGSDQYSQNGVALTVAGIAGVIAAAVGVPASWAVTIASSIYSALGSNIYSNIYYTTERYYATLEYSSSGPVTWYNKFITYVYSDKERTDLIEELPAEVYESTGPM